MSALRFPIDTGGTTGVGAEDGLRWRFDTTFTGAETFRLVAPADGRVRLARADSGRWTLAFATGPRTQPPFVGWLPPIFTGAELSTEPALEPPAVASRIFTWWEARRRQLHRATRNERTGALDPDSVRAVSVHTVADLEALLVEEGSWLPVEEGDVLWTPAGSFASVTTWIELLHEAPETPGTSGPSIRFSFDAAEYFARLRLRGDDALPARLATPFVIRVGRPELILVGGAQHVELHLPLAAATHVPRAVMYVSPRELGAGYPRATVLHARVSGGPATWSLAAPDMSSPGPIAEGRDAVALTWADLQLTEMRAGEPRPRQLDVDGRSVTLDAVEDAQREVRRLLDAIVAEKQRHARFFQVLVGGGHRRLALMPLYQELRALVDAGTLDEDLLGRRYREFGAEFAAHRETLTRLISTQPRSLTALLTSAAFKRQLSSDPTTATVELLAEVQRELTATVEGVALAKRLIAPPGVSGGGGVTPLLAWSTVVRRWRQGREWQELLAPMISERAAAGVVAGSPTLNAFDRAVDAIKLGLRDLLVKLEDNPDWRPAEARSRDPAVRRRALRTPAHRVSRIERAVAYVPGDGVLGRFDKLLATVDLVRKAIALGGDATPEEKFSFLLSATKLSVDWFSHVTRGEELGPRWVLGVDVDVRPAGAAAAAPRLTAGKILGIVGAVWSVWQSLDTVLERHERRDDDATAWAALALVGDAMALAGTVIGLTGAGAPLGAALFFAGGGLSLVAGTAADAATDTAIEEVARFNVLGRDSGRPSPFYRYFRDDVNEQLKALAQARHPLRVDLNDYPRGKGVTMRPPAATAGSVWGLRYWDAANTLIAELPGLRLSGSQGTPPGSSSHPFQVSETVEGDAIRAIFVLVETGYIARINETVRVTAWVSYAAVDAMGEAGWDEIARLGMVAWLDANPLVAKAYAPRAPGAPE